MPKTNNLRKELIHKNYELVFDKIVETIAFPSMDKPFNDSWKDEVYGLNNYRSKGCFLIMWLYTIEPPFYFYVNEACRKRDESLLNLLGPFASALH